MFVFHWAMLWEYASGERNSRIVRLRNTKKTGLIFREHGFVGMVPPLAG
jgi:hypothetical protein